MPNCSGRISNWRCLASCIFAAFALAALGCARTERIETFDAAPPTEKKVSLLERAPQTFAAAALQNGELELHFIKVGQGDSTLIKCPNGTSILVDCGSSKDQHPLAVRNYLRDQLGEDRIDVLLITHPDADHYNMIPYVLRDFEIGKLVMVGEIDEYSAYAYVTSASQTTFRGFQNWFEDIEPSIVLVVDEDDIDAPDDPSHDIFNSDDVDIYIVAAETPDSSSWSKNSRSIVLMVSYDEFDCLLTGDATFHTEKAIVDRYDDAWLDVDVLKLGHHGSRATSTNAAWADVVKPEVCVVSCSYSNSYGHPADDVRVNVEPHTVATEGHRMRWYRGPGNAYNKTKYQEATYGTARLGTIVVTTDGSTYSVVYSN